MESHRYTTMWTMRRNKKKVGFIGRNPEFTPITCEDSLLFFCRPLLNFDIQPDTHLIMGDKRKVGGDAGGGKRAKRRYFNDVS